MKRLILLFVFILAACAPPAAPMPVLPTQTLPPLFTLTPSPTSPLAPQHTSTPQFTPTISPTLAPYEQYTIEYLRKRTYDGGTLDLMQTLKEGDTFNTHLVRYLSDDIYIYAVMNIPNAAGIHPVVIYVHGYKEAKNYNILDYDFTMEDALAEAGFITIHPTLRNYYPSQAGDNLFRVGDAIDVLNLAEIVRSQSGQPGPLAHADGTHIGLGGHSMGGGVTLRVITIDHDIKAALLYAPVSGDESLNVPFFHNYTLDPQFEGEMDAPPEILEQISPENYYADITASVLLAHGLKDRLISSTWSVDTCQKMRAAQVKVTCFFYENADHSFYNEDLNDWINEAIQFYRETLG